MKSPNIPTEIIPVTVIPDLSYCIILTLSQPVFSTIYPVRGGMAGPAGLVGLCEGRCVNHVCETFAIDECDNLSLCRLAMHALANTMSIAQRSIA